MTTDDAFWSRVDRSGPVVRAELGPCWIWKGERHQRLGYGRVRRDGKRHLAHRWAWFLTHDRSPQPCALHRCDNTLCVRPDHLFEGTVTDNNTDKVAKDRQARGAVISEKVRGGLHPAARLSDEAVLSIRLAEIVAVYHEVYRVLRDDGLCWVNLGDTFAQGGRGGIGDASTLHGGAKGMDQSRAPVVADRVEGRETDLLGIPWRVVFALQRDGWIHRGEICWEKTAPMPESINGTRWVRHRKKVKNGQRPRDGREGAYPGKPRLKHSHHQVIDPAEWEDCPGCQRCSRPGEVTDGYILRRGSWRPTRSHEYVFLLAKSKGYYADEIAAKEPVTGGSHARGSGVHKKAAEPGSGIRQNESFSAAVAGLVGERNRRSVWTTGPQPFDPGRLNLGADVEGTEHFAVYPPALIEPMIAISTSRFGCCATCGAPFARMIGERLPAAGHIAGARERSSNEEHGHRGRIGHHNSFSVPYHVTQTVGWAPTCRCEPRLPVQAIVLDPFSGSGTTGLVAMRQGLRYIGIELNGQYALLARRRIEEDMPLFSRPREVADDRG